MKKAIILPLLLLLTISGHATGNLSALFSYCTFDVPSASPYLETYLHVVGNTVKFIPDENNSTKGQIEVQWTIRKGDSIVHFDMYNLNSPPHFTTDTLFPDFIDQQRLQLATGIYNLELSIKDKNSDATPIKVTESISIRFPADSLSISDIELIETYTKTSKQGKQSKSGYDIIPSVNAFYPKQYSELKFYAEVYRSNIVPADDYLVRCYISRYSNNEIIPAFSFNIRQKPAVTNVVMGEIPIRDLQSGNYYLNIEVRNKQNEQIAFRQIMFQRSNPQGSNDVVTEVSDVNVNNTFAWWINDQDSLMGLIDCLHPIATHVEIDVSDQLMNMRDVNLMQKFLFYFWQKRDPKNPEGAWRAYMVEVEKTNQMFPAMGMKGYATDRGRVYLQYGPPNTVSNDTKDPSTYPYEIWHYYKLQNQTNRKFIFYSKEISSNEYKLLHSDAIGELRQPQWHAILHEKSNARPIGIDQREADDVYGSRSKERFENPR